MSNFVLYLTVVPGGQFLGPTEINQSEEDAARMVASFKRSIINRNRVNVGSKSKLSGVLSKIGLDFESSRTSEYWTENVNEENNETELNMRRQISRRTQVKYWYIRSIILLTTRTQWSVF